MEKYLIKIRTVCIVSVLSVSLCFSSVTASYYQAAALAPAVWTLIETLFLSLGITLHLSDSVNKEVVNEEIAQEVQEMAEKIESGEQKGPLLELADCLKNIHMYWEPVTGLTIPQTIWEAFKYYCGFKQATSEPYYSALIAGYPITLEQSTPLFGTCDLSTIVTDDALYYVLYNYATGGCGEYNEMHCLVSSKPIFITVNVSSNKLLVRYNVDLKADVKKEYRSTNGISWNVTNNISSNIEYFSSNDYISVNQYSQYVASNHIITDIYGEKVFGMTTDRVVDIPLDDYDVLTPGREWDEEKEKLVGDVTLNIPSEKILEDYYNGLLTWEQVMELIGAEPVDTTKPLEGEIPKEDTSEGIIDVILDIPGAIVDGIAGLFLPREGFIEGRFELVMKRIEQLGILPYDMSDIFKNVGNPFRDIKIKIYGQEVVIVSFEYLPDFLDKFRPAIRGLMAIFMFYYSINQFLGLLRISGLIQGDNNGGGSAKETGGAAK